MEDLTGRKFGRLTAIRRVGKNKKRESLWLCQCVCGRQKIIVSTSLKKGGTRSCGCLMKEVASKKAKIKKMALVHGFSGSRLYEIWCGIKSRCQNPNDTCYKYYGGRGISVCPEWQNYLNFHDWAINNGYNDSLTIERIDNDGNYEPNNCRWITKEEQARNKRTSRLITYNGETKSLIQWAEILNIKYSSLCNRLHKGWSVEKAFNTPLRKLSNKKGANNNV